MSVSFIESPITANFQVYPHNDSGLESLTAVDVEGGRIFYDNTWVSAAALSNVGSPSEPYIVGSFNKTDMTLTLSASSNVPPTSIDTESDTITFLVAELFY